MSVWTYLSARISGVMEAVRKGNIPVTTATQPQHLYGLQFRCKACNAMRPDAQISVRSLDTSEANGMPAGTLKENFNYCNDRPACRETAQQWKGFLAK